MLELEDAQERIISSISPCPAELVPLGRALGRVAARSVVAPIPLPPFDNSAMDGYALRAADVRLASIDKPVVLRDTGSIAAGARVGSATVEPGTCLRIFTGAQLPHGADAVVMQEDTRCEGNVIEVRDSIKPWENVRLAGEDIREGAMALNAGVRITPGRIALLGALGIQDLLVTKQPIVGVLSTGNELVEGGTPAPGQIFESNRNALGALLTQAGALVRLYPIVGDTLLATRAALENALAECDCVVTTGGVSVGEYDVVKDAFVAMGGSLEFWRVSVKPGKPFVFGRWREKFLLGLPGNPVSAFVTCLLLVYPAVLKFQGAKELRLPEHPAVLADHIANRGDRRHFMRVTIDRLGMVRAAGLQASHALSCLANANGLLSVPPNTSWPSGHTVHVLRWGFLESA